MVSLILLALGTISAYVLTKWYLDFLNNLRLAKASGIHYFVVPVFFLNRFWLITHQLWLYVLRYVPERYTYWVDFCLPEFTYDYRYEIFKRVGHDTFLTVSPGRLSLFTADPAVISQITNRRNDFPKPTAMYRTLDIYGKNVVSSEGHMWRQHRKATSPPFTETNNHLVWSESIRQSSAMLKAWTGADGKGSVAVDRLMDDTMRLSLHVISCAGFGRKIDWPVEKSTVNVNKSYDDHSKIQNEADDTDPGHTMSYTYALHSLLDNILLQFLFPRWLLKKIPNKTLRKADEAYDEWGSYMKEAVTKKKEEMETKKANSEQVDILAQLVKAQLVSGNPKGAEPLMESEILGNMFVLILAGHETAANVLHFSSLYMALHPGSQRRLQKDLDRIFQGRPSSEWDYDRDLPALFGGMAGAVLAEELRLLPAVVGIPKSTIGVPDQKLMVDGKECIVPTGTNISICAASAHRNPKYWPSSPPTLPGGHTVHPTSNLDNDLEEFRPERWLDHDKLGETSGKGYKAAEKLGGGDIEINEASDTSDDLFRPVKGSYVPFSSGYRACLGRRFAQVEILATLAVLFQNHSAELSVAKYASDGELEKMDDDARAEVWQKAAEDARDLMLNGMSSIISLQMRKGHVPLRFVPRGQEKFEDNVDELWKKNHPTEVSNKGIPGWSCWRDSLDSAGHRVRRELAPSLIN